MHDTQYESWDHAVFEVVHDGGEDVFTNGHQACTFASRHRLQGQPSRSVKKSVTRLYATMRGCPI